MRLITVINNCLDPLPDKIL